MQPLILLAIVGVAAVALSAGSLTNVIQLDVQQFGVGEETIETPVTNADVSFNIGQLSTNGVFHNVVDECTINASASLPTGTLVFCKLTDIDGAIIAEGSKTLAAPVATGGDITVPIDNFAFPLSHVVQNVHDVMVVIQVP